LPLPQPAEHVGGGLSPGLAQNLVVIGRLHGPHAAVPILEHRGLAAGQRHEDSGAQVLGDSCRVVDGGERNLATLFSRMDEGPIGEDRGAQGLPRGGEVIGWRRFLPNAQLVVVGIDHDPLARAANAPSSPNSTPSA
jgi:hypothetical protein